MAHPFRYFRKHQKAFLAVAAVIAMFVFVIGDYMMAMIGQGGVADPNEVVASWKGGRMTIGELQVLAERRYFISQFLYQLRGTGASKMMESGGTPMMPQVPDFVLPENSTPRDVQVGVVTTRILAEQARKAGITISDEVINYFLKQTSFNRVTDSEIMAMLQGVRGGGDPRGLEDQLFTGLRELLLGNAYFATFNANIRNILPEQRWEDWKRLNDRISLEAAAVPVSDFVKEVPEPKETELLAFYEDHKDNVGHQPHVVLGAILPSADPGFKVPRRVKLSYLLGDVNAWSEKYRDSVTEEEIADYYERNKRTQFVKTDGEPAPEDQPGEPASAAGGAENEIEDQPGEPASAGGEDEIDEQPGEPASEEQRGAPEESDSSSTPRERNFHLAAFQEDLEAEPDADGEAAMKEAVEEAATGEPASDAGEPASAGGEESDTTEYEPLDSVRDTIRNKLATDKAVIELKKVMDRIYGQMHSVYNPYGFEVVKARTEDKDLPPPPKELTNLKERAAETGLISEETVPLTQRELADTAVGKALEAQSQSQFVVQAAFDDLALHQPMLAQDLDGNWYLVTKVEDVPEKVPDFKDIETEVERAWKLREAAQLALKKAEELATAAQDAGNTLGTFFIGKPYEVLTTDMFSFLTFGTTPAEMQRGPKLGDAPPMEAVGLDIMNKAFELKENEVAAMLNYDQSQAYVFRLNERELPPDELKALFLKEANDWFGGQMMMMARWQNQQRQLLEELTDRVGLDLEKLEEHLQPQDEEEQ